MNDDGFERYDHRSSRHELREIDGVYKDGSRDRSRDKERRSHHHGRDRSRSRDRTKKYVITQLHPKCLS